MKPPATAPASGCGPRRQPISRNSSRSRLLRAERDVVGLGNRDQAEAMPASPQHASRTTSSIAPDSARFLSSSMRLRGRRGWTRPAPESVKQQVSELAHRVRRQKPAAHQAQARTTPPSPTTPATGARRRARWHNGAGNGDDTAAALAVGPGGGAIYVTGASRGFRTAHDHATVTYSGATGAQLRADRYTGPGTRDDGAAFEAVSPSPATCTSPGPDAGPPPAWTRPPSPTRANRNPAVGSHTTASPSTRQNTCGAAHENG